MDSASRVDISMQALNKRIEVMRKKNELSLLQSEIRRLEIELVEMESVGEQTLEVKTKAERPARRLPTVPVGRYQSDKGKPPELHLYDESSITGATGEKVGPVVIDSFVEPPITSTPGVVKPKVSTKIKPATYDGTGHWSDYKAHFDACAEINGWTEKEKGLYLAVSLRGQAQGVFGNLATKSCKYDELTKALEERFAPPNQTELYRVQLKERRQRASETLTELGQHIWRLTNLAYATAPVDVRETLAKEQFIDCLHNSDMRLRIKKARPKSLNEAVRHAVELEAFNKAEKKHEGTDFMRTTAQHVVETTKTQDGDIKALQGQLRDIQLTLQGLTKQSRFQPNTEINQSNSNGRGMGRGRTNYSQSFKRKCFDCGSENHLKRNCPKNQGSKEADVKPDQQMKNVSNAGAGLYANCKVDNIQTQCLVDTGATLTLLSIGMWESLKPCSSPILEKYEGNVFTASGTPLEVKGKTSVFIEINGIHCLCKVVAASIDLDLILGLDFFKGHNCQIDVSKNTLTIQGKPCKLICSGSIGCYRIALEEKIEIPAMSEIVIEGKVLGLRPDADGLYIVEPKGHILDDRKTMIARSLSYCKGKTPFRLMNLSAEA